MMNRRDFLKILGSLPLIGLAGKSLKIPQDIEFDGMTTSDINTLDGEKWIPVNDKWHSLVIVSEDNKQSIYMDGELVSEKIL